MTGALVVLVSPTVADEGDVARRRFLRDQEPLAILDLGPGSVSFGLDSVGIQCYLYIVYILDSVGIQCYLYIVYI